MVVNLLFVISRPGSSVLRPFNRRRWLLSTSVRHELAMFLSRFAALLEISWNDREVWFFFGMTQSSAGGQTMSLLASCLRPGCRLNGVSRSLRSRVIAIRCVYRWPAGIMAQSLQSHRRGRRWIAAEVGFPCAVVALASPRRWHKISSAARSQEGPPKLTPLKSGGCQADDAGSDLMRSAFVLCDYFRCRKSARGCSTAGVCVIALSHPKRS